MRCLLLLAACALALVGCSGDEGKPTTSTDGGTTTPFSATADASPSPGTGTTKAIGVVGCRDGSECESGVCFVGNAQSFCTVRCTADDAAQVCVAPLTGTCNRQGFCKRD